MRRITTVLALFFLVSCAMPNNTLDPRDESAVREWDKSCDTRSMRIRLDVRNYNVSDVQITLVRRDGGERALRPRINGGGKEIYNLNRNDFTQGNYFMLVQKAGMTYGPAFVELQPIMCDRGFLEIGASLNLSFFIGAKWD